MSHNTTPAPTPNILQRTLDKLPTPQAVTAAGAVILSLVTGCGPNTEAKPSPTSAPSTLVRPEGVLPPERPFATMPFPAKDGQNLVVTNSWPMAENEARILGTDPHKALDIEGIACGTPVLAPFDGVAVASYQADVAKGGKKPYDPNNSSDPDADYRNPNNGQEGTLGLAGNFVEVISDVQAPNGNNYAMWMFHLASAADGIKWIAPERKTDFVEYNGNTVSVWYPAGVRLPQARLKEEGTPVRKGDIIGFVGNSGIGVGDEKFNPNTHRADPHNTPGDLPWDPQDAGTNSCQTHVELDAGRDPKLKRTGLTDLLDNYAQITDITNPITPKPGLVIPGEKPALIIGDDNRPKFADDPN